MKKILMLFVSLLFISSFTVFAAEPIHIKISEDLLVPVSVVERMETAKLVLTMPLKSETITMIATGDIIFHIPQIKSAYNKERNIYDFTESFSKIKPIVERADFALANFEGTTPGDNFLHSAEYMFRVPDESFDALKDAGFDFFATANNHSFDGRLAGLDRTIEMIRSRDMRHTGTFLDDDLGPRYEVVEVKGLRLCIFSASYNFNGFEYYYEPDIMKQKVNNMDESALEETVHAMKSENPDFIIAYLHWGNEYFSNPSVYQQEMMEKVFSYGVDIILGSHPHVVQRDEYRMNGKKLQYVAYSLGNFISNQNRSTLDTWDPERTEDGVLLHFTFTKDVLGYVTLEKITPVPTWVYRRFEDGVLKHTILSIYDSEPQKMIEASKQRTLEFIKGFKRN